MDTKARNSAIMIMINDTGTKYTAERKAFNLYELHSRGLGMGNCV